MIETVDEHCKHKDCKYRGTIMGLGFGTQWCMYFYITNKLRGCAISECDKYTTGKRKIKSTMDGVKFIVDDREVI